MQSAATNTIVFDVDMLDHAVLQVGLNLWPKEFLAAEKCVFPVGCLHIALKRTRPLFLLKSEAEKKQQKKYSL